MAASFTETVTIVNQRGLHARAAAKLVKCAGTFDARIDVCRGDVCVPATSIMGLMMLAAAKGNTLHITAQGREAAQALTAVVTLITDRFDEDE